MGKIKRQKTLLAFVPLEVSGNYGDEVVIDVRVTGKIVSVERGGHSINMLSAVEMGNATITSLEISKLYKQLGVD